MNLNADQVTRPATQRGPAMVVYESPKPAQVTPPADLKQGEVKPGSAKLNSGAAKQSAAPAGPAGAPSVQTAQPVIIPGGHASGYGIQPAVGLSGTTGNPVYDDIIKKAASRHGVDPNLIVAVMRQESGFNAGARSYKGASGLMQLMPATARRFGVTNIYDPAQNIDGGTRYLRFLLDMFEGDVELALAGYNAGEGAVTRYGYRVPPYRETQNYVRSISARYGRSSHQAPKINQTVAANKTTAAPSAISFTSGSSNRLSNNY